MGNNDTIAAAENASTNATTTTATTNTANVNRPMCASDLIIASRETFDGSKKCDGAQWLRVFERLSGRMKLTDAEMVEDAVCLLKGAAEKWYTDELDRGKVSPVASWAQWKRAFIGKYVEVETIDELMDQLLVVQQGKVESVEDYGTRVTDLARKVGSEVTPRLVLSVFKKGLQQTYQVELEKSECKTLEEALSIATKKEKNSKIEKKVISEEKDVVKLFEEMQKMKLRLMNAEAVAKKNNSCYSCFEPGHASKDCPLRVGEGAKKLDKDKGDLRFMDIETDDDNDDDYCDDFIDIEIDEEELLDYVGFDGSGEIRVLTAKRTLDESDEKSEPESKKLKLRIPTEVFKKKQALDAEKKSRNYDGGFAPRTYNLHQKIATMSSGMTLLQAIEECPRIRNQMRQFCDSKHEARTISAEPTSTPSTSVRIGDEELCVLIDGGASVNIMSKEVARKLGLKVDSQNKLTRLTLGDGRKNFSQEIVRGVGLNFGKLNVVADFLILKMPDYQLLLGRGFLKQVNATTDWKNALFKFEYDGVKYEFVDGSKHQTTGNLNLIETDECYIDRDLRIMGNITEDIELDDLFMSNDINDDKWKFENGKKLPNWVMEDFNDVV